MNCPACRSDLAAGARSCPTCGSLIAFGPDHPQARLGAPLPPWEQAVMEARRPALAHQQPPVRSATPLRSVPSAAAAQARPGHASSAASPAAASSAASPSAQLTRSARAARPARPSLPEVSLSALAPLRLLWAHLLGVRGLSAWFLLFATAPFVLLQLTADDPDFSHAAWGFAVYFALVWGLCTPSCGRSRRAGGCSLRWWQPWRWSAPCWP